MKVRIGVGAGGPGLDGPGLGAVVDTLEELGFDSLWLAEVLTADSPDPVAGLAWAAARSRKLKLGTTILGPSGNVVRLAKSLADVDVLSDGRLLVTIVPGLARGPERSAVGVPVADRGAILDDLIPVLRRLWAGEELTHHGPAGDLDGVRLARLPRQTPLEPWLGGMVPNTLRRCGRLGDGWLPSSCTPSEVAAARLVIDEAAEAAGRQVHPEHFGVSIGYSLRPIDARTRASIEARSRGHQAEEIVPVGHQALRELLEGFLAVGFSKFVVRPLDVEGSWDRELRELSKAVGDLQN